MVLEYQQFFIYKTFVYLLFESENYIAHNTYQYRLAYTYHTNLVHLSPYHLMELNIDITYLYKNC